MPEKAADAVKSQNRRKLFLASGLWLISGIVLSAVIMMQVISVMMIAIRETKLDFEQTAESLQKK